MAIVILAGGQSRRMGQDKALLPFKQSTLLQTQIDYFEAGTDAVVYCSQRQPTHKNQSLSETKYPPRSSLISQKDKNKEVDLQNHIGDLFNNKGPLGGIYSTLKQLAGQYQSVVYLPVDMPELTCTMVNELFAHSTKAEMVAFEGQLFPFCLNTSYSKPNNDHKPLKDSKLTSADDAEKQNLNEIPESDSTINFSDLKRRILSDDRSLRSFLEQFSVHRLDGYVGNERLFNNINTPSEWKKFKENT